MRLPSSIRTIRPMLLISLLSLLVAACNLGGKTPRQSSLPSATNTPAPTVIEAKSNPTLLAVSPSATASQTISTPTLTPSLTSTATAVPKTSTPTSWPPTAVVREKASCRTGPDPHHGSIATYHAGTQLQIDGRNADWSWWRVKMPGATTSCYIFANLVDEFGDLSSVPEITASSTSSTKTVRPVVAVPVATAVPTQTATAEP